MNMRPLYSGPFYQSICVILSFVLATGPSAAVMAQPPSVEPPTGDVPTADQPINNPPGRDRVGGDTTLLAAPQAGKIDLTYVTPQAVFLAVARPSELLRAPAAQMFPVEVASAAGLQYLGFDPANVSEATLFVEPPAAGPPLFGLAICFDVPFNGSTIPENLRGHTQPGELAGRRYLQSAHPQMPSFYMPNDRTLLVAPDAALRQMLSVSELQQTGPLFERVQGAEGASDFYAVIDIASLRPMIAPLVNMAVAQQGEKFPDELRPFLDAPNLISAIELTLSLSASGPTSLVVHANDAASADKLVKMVDDAFEMRRQAVEAQIAVQMQSDDPLERAFAQYAKRMSDTMADGFRPQRRDDSLVLFHMVGDGGLSQNPMVTVGVAGVLVALLLPAVQAAREAARRSQSVNNLRQLLLALLNHESAYRTFPAHAIYSDDGKPLLSWRIRVLPFLEQQQLYEQFHLDEPWDSPHNRDLIAQMPLVFANPNLDLEEGKTNYLAVVGQECVFDGTAEGMQIRKITDGTSRTVMLVEADPDQAVIWTKPDDFEFNVANPTAGLGGLRPGGWQAAWCDGSVSFIGNDVDKETINAAFTRAGGEAFERP